MQVEVYFDSKQDYVDLLKEGLDITERHEDHFVIVTDADELSELNAAGFDTRVVHQDLTAFYQ
jgi:hypothetical protein